MLLLFSKKHALDALMNTLLNDGLAMYISVLQSKNRKKYVVLRVQNRVRVTYTPKFCSNEQNILSGCKIKVLIWRQITKESDFIIHSLLLLLHFSVFCIKHLLIKNRSHYNISNLREFVFCKNCLKSTICISMQY